MDSTVFPVTYISPASLSVVPSPRAAFKPVLGTAIGTQCFTGILYGEKDARMRIP